MSETRRVAGKPVGMPIARPIPFPGRSKEDIGAAVVGVVDASHLGVGDEDSRHLVVSDVTERLVEAAISPGSAGGEEVAVGTELRVWIVLHQQGLPVAIAWLGWRNLGFGRPNRGDHVDIPTGEQLIKDGVVPLQDDAVFAFNLCVSLRLRQAVEAHPEIPVRVAELVPALE